MRRPGRHLAFGLRLVAAAAKEILRRRGRTTVARKRDGSAVTAADRAAERAMRTMIRRAFPDHGILGEEAGAEHRDRDWQWLLDPLDGTAQFALGLPLFGVLVALVHRREPQLGVMHFPTEAATLFASRGGGCWYRRANEGAHRVRCANRCRGLAAARVSFSDIGKREARDAAALARFGRVVAVARESFWIGGCVQHALVARGLIDAAIDTFAHPWDAAAVVACVREAGGVVSTLQGDETDAVFGGSLVSSANRRVHTQLIAALNDAPAAAA